MKLVSTVPYRVYIWQGVPSKFWVSGSVSTGKRVIFTGLLSEAFNPMEYISSNIESIPSTMSADADIFVRVATQEVNSKQDTPVIL